MGYVIAAVILLLIVAAGVTVLVLNATKRKRQPAAADSEYGEGTPGTDMAIVASDENTPLGDTDQHAGEQTQEGRTVGEQDAEHAGGTGRPAGGGYEGTGGIGSSERPSSTTPASEKGGLGGEGEGSRHVTPQSERLANRDR